MRSRLAKRKPRLVWRVLSALLLGVVLIASTSVGLAFIKIQQTADAFLTPLEGKRPKPLESMQ
ncbi:hypothetical protein OVA29_16045 [Exiguobacterium sp. SL14]|nr:hypothetical protein [Exiguobacterium sp. SL14]MCY1691954.1 hypothetical protein [Exiguobacterium sp. SL14]